MKKVISIGRGDEADININDELVSRRHATIRFLPFGKMEIRDLSKNGTYVNGIRLAVNKPYPITRKDVVSFARVSQLDWKEVPDPMRPYRIGAFAVLAFLVCLVIVAIISNIDWSKRDKSTNMDEEQVEEVVNPKKDNVNEKPAPSGEQANKSGEKQVDKTIPNLFPKKDKNKDKDKNQKVEKEDQKKTDQDKKSEDPEKKDADSQNHWLMP